MSFVILPSVFSVCGFNIMLLSLQTRCGSCSGVGRNASNQRCIMCQGSGMIGYEVNLFNQLIYIYILFYIKDFLNIEKPVQLNLNHLSNLL